MSGVWNQPRAAKMGTSREISPQILNSPCCPHIWQPACLIVPHNAQEKGMLELSTGTVDILSMYILPQLSMAPARRCTVSALLDHVFTDAMLMRTSGIHAHANAHAACMPRGM